MPDAKQGLPPLTPLGGTKPRTDVHGPITLRENTTLAMASFAARLGQQEAAKNVLRTYLGVEPAAPGMMTMGEISAFWLGPDQWMVMAPFSTHENMAEDLAIRAAGKASISEQTDGWCRFDATGEGLADVFERLCAVNVRAAKGGEASRTSIAHLGCFVLIISPRHIAVLGPRSSAGSLHHTLLTALKSAFCGHNAMD